MAIDAPPVNQRKLMAAIYTLIALFAALVIGIAVYFTVLSALNFKDDTAGIGLVTPDSAINTSEDNSEPNRAFEDVFQKINQIYQAPAHVEATVTEVVEAGEEGLEDGEDVDAAHLEHEELESGPAKIDTKLEERVILLPTIRFNGFEASIQNLFCNPRIEANFRMSSTVDVQPQPIHFMSHSAYLEFVNYCGMKLLDEFSVLTNDGSRVTVLIAFSGSLPTNIDKVLAAISAGQNIPELSSCTQSFILHFKRPLSIDSIRASVKKTHTGNLIEFKNPFGLKYHSALVLSHPSVDLSDLDPNFMSSEALLALYASSKELSELRKDTLLVDEIEYTLIVATKAETADLDVGALFNSLKAELKTYNGKDSVFKSTRDLPRPFLLVIVWEGQDTLLLPPEPIVQALSKSPSKIVRPSLFPALWAPSLYEAMAFSVQNIFSLAKVGTYFAVTKGSVATPDSSHFRCIEDWDDGWKLNVPFNVEGVEFVAYFTVALNHDVAVDISSELASQIVKNPSELTEKWGRILENNLSSWPEDGFGLLIVPVSE